jgi:serine/threonine protein kinase
MEILYESTIYETVDGKSKFFRKSYYVRQDSITYYGSWKDQSSKPTDLSQFEKLTIIKTHDRGPKIQDTWALASQEEYYLKAPAVNDFIHSDLERTIQRQIEIWEVLRRNPHPNIAIYYGCREENGRVTGLCFKRYTQTLFNKVNPRFLNKKKFQASGREHVDDSLKENVYGILEGIKHLHSLGLVHNNIKPASIMLDEHGVPVIMNFGSCLNIGERLWPGCGGRTDGWYDPGNEIVLEKNDLDAFEELKTWLFGSGTYLFDEEVFRE